jgi:hypothetical protein
MDAAADVSIPARQLTTPEPADTPTAHMNKCLLAASQAGATMFRNSVGQGWVGHVVRRIRDRMVLENPRPLHAGLATGSADLIGWTPVTITPEMVGQTLAVFTALEVKLRTGRPSHEQANFLRTVEDAGGIAAAVRTPDEAAEIVSRCRRGK